MLFYNVLFLFLILLRVLMSDTPKLRRQIYPIVLTILFVISAFRFEVGCDWTGYLYRYYVYSALPYEAILTDREPLWAAITILQGWLRIPYPWVNVFSSLVFFAGAHAMARRQPDPLAFLILLYPVLIINMPMSGIRQGAAIGVMFMAYVAFNDRATFRYVVLTLIASGFHQSALVFLLLTPLASGHYSRARLFLAALLAIPGSLLILSGEAAETATSRYVDTDVDAVGAAFRVGLIFLTAVYFHFLLRRKWALAFPQDFKIVSVGALLMFGMIVLVPISTVIGDRLAYYLIPIQAMMFARIPYLPIRTERTLKASLPYVVLVAMLLVWTMYSWHFSLCYVPYKTWLFGFPVQAKFAF